MWSAAPRQLRRDHLRVWPDDSTQLGDTPQRPDTYVSGRCGVRGKRYADSRNIKVNVLPVPNSLSISIVPPSSSASLRESRSPSPVPSRERTAAESTRPNSANSLVWSYALMPMPVSLTHILTSGEPLSPPGSSRANSIRTSPASVNLIALLTRLIKI